MVNRLHRIFLSLLFGRAGLVILEWVDRRSSSAGGTAAPAAAARADGRPRGPAFKLPVRRVIWVVTILLFAGATTMALFTDTSANDGNTYGSSSDWKAPTVSASVIQRNGGNNGSTGYVKQGQSYFVYANVTDAGNPASGVGTVTANVCNVTTASCGTVAMTAGSYTVNSVSYNYRSASLTSDNPLSAGSKGYSITAADNNSNSATNNSFSVTVDNTAPSISPRVCGGSGCTTTSYAGAGKTYYVYAQVTDSGTGVDTVTADPRNLTAAASATTAMSTSGGPWTIGGTSYNYRSIQLTADAGLANGNSFNYTVTAADNVTNSASPSASTTVDNVAPTVSASGIAKAFGRLNGSVRANGAYLIVANLADTASGVETSTVTLDASSLTAGRTSVPMCYSAGGHTINRYGDPGTESWQFRFDSDGTPCDATLSNLTVDNGLSGAKIWTLNFKDNAGNSASPTDSVTLDNASGSGTSHLIKNASGGTVGRLEQNDTITYSMDGSVDPESILSGWTGSATSSGQVVVRLTDGGGSCVASSDQLQVFNAANSAATNLGTVCLGGTGYNTSGSTITFGATGTKSQLSHGCLTACTTVTLGTQSAAAATQAGSTTAVWTPTASIYDAAGNPYLTTNVSGPVDNTAPTLTRAQIQRTANNNPGFIRQGDQYYVYAEVADTGGSGLDTAAITANVAVASNVISTGKTTVMLCSNGGPFTVGGQSYAYRSDDDGTCGGTATTLTSDASITDGAKTYNVTFRDNAANTTTGTPTVTEDSTAPTVSTSTLSKSTGYLAGRLKSAVAYYPYANVTDAGVGISTVTANVSNVTAGQTALAMTSGSYSTQGVSYNYRPASTVTSGTLTNNATYTWTLTPTDLLGNTATPSGTNATGDTAAPDASDIQCTNVGTAGRPNNGDICNFTHTENIDPFSVSPIASWTGTSTTVAVRFLDAGTGSSPAACDTGTNDTMVIYNAANAAQVTAMGCLNLGDTDYVTANGTCTASTLIQPTVPGTVNRVTLGGCPTLVTGTGTSTTGYFPSTSLYDAAGVNLTDATVQNETGTADRDF